MIFLETLAHTLLIPGTVLALVPYLILRDRFLGPSAGDRPGLPCGSAGRHSHVLSSRSRFGGQS